MTTLGAAGIGTSQSEIAQGEVTQNDVTQDFGTELRSESKQVFKDSTVLQDSEGIKQKTVDSSTNEIGSQTKVASNDPKIADISQKFGHRAQETTFENVAPVEQKMSSTISNISIETSSQAQESGSEAATTIHGSQDGSQDSSQKRLKDLMREFKSLLEDYHQQTLKLAKNFATVTESKDVSGDISAIDGPSVERSGQNLDLSAIGNVVVQQKDLDSYESGLVQLNQALNTLNTMESELEASLRKAEYHELSRKDLEAAHLEMLERLANTSETRCGATNTPDVTKGKHLDRVGRLCAQIAQTLNCGEDFINNIASSARLHDIGKLAIPDSILQKPDRLDADEYATMKMHTIHGAEMLANNSSEIVQMAQRIALTHHENWDGSGYPYQLKREEIALEGRIAAVADVYDALISTRIYKEAWPKEKAIEQIKSRSGTKFDPMIVEAFLKIVA